MPSAALDSDPPRAAAKLLAARLNLVLVAGFCLWLTTQTVFWLRTFGPTRPFGVPVPELSPWPWLATSVALGLITFALPRAFLRPRPFEMRGALYRALGVRAFRRVMTNGDLINRIVRRRHPGYVVNGGDDSLAGAMANTIEAERAHLPFLVAGAGAALYALQIGWTGWAAWHALGNLVCNLYPILLQRYTRGRIARLSPETVRRALA